MTAEAATVTPVSSVGGVRIYAGTLGACELSTSRRSRALCRSR